MGVELPSLIDTLVHEELRRMIGDVKADGGSISAPALARAILRTYPACGFTQTDLENKIMMAASDAGVAVELGGRAKKLNDIRAFTAI
jgi:hypothetical protein